VVVASGPVESVVVVASTVVVEAGSTVVAGVAVVGDVLGTAGSVTTVGVTGFVVAVMVAVVVVAVAGGFAVLTPGTGTACPTRVVDDTPLSAIDPIEGGRGNAEESIADDGPNSIEPPGMTTPPGATFAEISAPRTTAMRTP
jgi:hypothetical protein